MRGLAVGGKRLARERSGGREDNDRQSQFASKRPKVSLKLQTNPSKACLGEHERQFE